MTESKAALAAEAHPESHRPGMGHNRPPFLDFYRETNESLPSYLEEDAADLLKRFNDLVEAFEQRTPTEVDSKELNDKFTDFVNKKIAACKSALKGKHADHKEPFLTGGRTVDAFYKRRIDRLDEIATECRKRQTVWNLKVEADKRHIAEEAERKARAAQAEADRIAAEERRKAAEIAAEQERQAAAERRRREEEEREAKRISDEAAAKIKNEQDLARQIEMEAEEKKRQAARAEQVRLDNIAAEARRIEQEAVAKAAAEEAERRRVEAEDAAKAALAKSTDLTRSRGDQGGVSSLRSEWKGETEDRAILDLETLRSHFKIDHLNAAVESYVKAHAPKEPGSTCPPLKGARIWEHKFTR